MLYIYLSNFFWLNLKITKVAYRLLSKSLSKPILFTANVSLEKKIRDNTTERKSFIIYLCYYLFYIIKQYNLLKPTVAIADTHVSCVIYTFA